jgi:hypothetical protein
LRVIGSSLRNFLCARAVSGDEGAGQGNIINIPSSTFCKGVAHYIHYTTSRAAR